MAIFMIPTVQYRATQGPILRESLFMSPLALLKLPFLSPGGLVCHSCLQDDWKGYPWSGDGTRWQDQEAKGGGGGASPALPSHRRRHGQGQELGLPRPELHPQGDVWSISAPLLGTTLYALQRLVMWACQKQGLVD